MKTYVLIHDKEKTLPLQTYYEKQEDLFKKRNAEGWGVYFAVNDFEATQEEMNSLGVKTKRNIPFLRKLNYVFADLDVAKAGDGQTREAKEQKKEDLLFALYDVLPPSLVIDTSNGIQPLWELKDCPIDVETQKRYTRTINGIIEWSKQHGGAGDKVKDVTRILRLEGYNHMKQEPYLVTIKQRESFVYSLDEIEKAFEKFLPVEEPEKFYKPVDKSRLDSLSLAIDRLDFQEVIIKAFSSIGRRAEFDHDNRLILDNRLTGNFQGKKDSKEYLASTSHEPFEGNKITAVADIKQINNKEARAWIIEEFGLRERVKKTEVKDKVQELMKPQEVKEKKNYYSWGTKELTENFALIKQTTYSIIGGGYGVGKTPFCVNLALENTKLGHKVLYLSLEMDTEEINDFLARKAASIETKEELYSKIPDYKKTSYDKKRKELQENDNFVLKGVRGGIDITWDCLVELMEGNYDLIIVDNFNLVKRIEGLSQWEHEGELSTRFLAYTQQKQTPIIVVHHYSKGGAGAIQKTGYSLGGNAKIMNDAQRIVLLERKTFDPEDDREAPTDKQKAMLKVTLDKARAYDRGIIKIIYFHKGGFLDNYPEERPDYWQNK